MKRIPFPCDFCGQVVLPSGRLNHSDACESCRKPRRPKTILVAVKAPVDRVAWKAAS